nr:hypothetical protein [uncultured Ruminococcus sp.]
MGWFVMSDEEIQLRDDFRPRLGMGWFTIFRALNYLECQKFSSPLGDGLVRGWSYVL